MRVFKVTQVGNVTSQATNTTTTREDKPFRPGSEDMRAKLKSLMQQVKDERKATDSKSLVNRALVGTPDEQLFS